MKTSNNVVCKDSTSEDTNYSYCIDVLKKAKTDLEEPKKH